MIAGYTYITDFIQIPVCVIDANGTLREKTGKIYQRILPTEPDNNPGYVIKKRLTSDTEDFFYYHPAIPFDLKKSDCTCKDWLSWEIVQIPDEAGKNVEMIKLIRIKPGTDIQHIDVTATNLCLIIKCKFESRSDMNWNNWLVLGGNDADLEITTISPYKSKKNKNCYTATPTSDAKETSGEKKKRHIDNGAKKKENVPIGNESIGMAKSEDDVVRRIEKLERKDRRRKQLETFPSRIDNSSTSFSNVNDNYPILRKIKKERVDKCENNSSSGDERTTVSWSGSQYVDDTHTIDHVRVM